MSFVSAAAAAAQSFSSETDSDALFVLDSNYVVGTDPREPSPLDLDPNLISPFLSQADSDPLTLSSHFDVPDGSGLAPGSGRYPHGDLSDLEDDAFFAIDFANTGGDASLFVGSQGAWPFVAQQGTAALTASRQEVNELAAYPLTPEQTASIYGTTPRSDPQAGAAVRPNSISPRELFKPFAPAPLVIPTPQLGGLSLDSSGQSSEEGLAPGPFTTTSQSPRVTVSVWDQDNNRPIHTIERTFEDDPIPDFGEPNAAGDLISMAGPLEQSRASSRPEDPAVEWSQDAPIVRGGLEPKRRLAGEVMSINEIARKQRMDERNQQVGDWAAENTREATEFREKTHDEIQALEEENRGADDDVPFGSSTENRYVLGHTYYHHGGAAAAAHLTEEDYSIILQNRNWADAPVLHGIQVGKPGQNQPQSSQAAIEKFERMCRDNDSIISRTATWGTRRRSLPSDIDLDMESITSGSFLKKLSISRGSGGRPGSLLRDLRGLVRRPSAAATIRKRSRSRSGQGDGMLGRQSHEQQAAEEPPLTKKESASHLSPMSRTSSWGKKPAPSINEALLSLGHNFASIGAGRHSRSGSVSNAPTAGPARSSLSSLGVKNSLRRQRSKSELPKPCGIGESQSTLANLWWKSGGPPVAPMISRTQASPEEEEDEEEDPLEDQDIKANPNMIDDIAPIVAGFQLHIQRLNPSLTARNFLVERIAQQQVVRYKSLLTCKVKHLGLGANCPSGPLCLAMGGSSANVLVDLTKKADAREADPAFSFSSSFENDDGGATTEMALNQESFPADIPLPPTQRLPAEFECQLCYECKELKKPSDWTKHVHEDVQPFTCTWERCREPKMFKRKADWVRHENEGHRHLEWWDCDVEECRHICYRRDNFLQHLVREHKFAEPKVKNKAALKVASKKDPTWQRVEQCHRETTRKPEDEPCRFCGKRLPTWKKLTVHLAKHMEQIALPVLRLVAAKAKELGADSVISPVLDRPPHQGFHESGEQRRRLAAAAPQPYLQQQQQQQQQTAFDASLMGQSLLLQQQQQQQDQFMCSMTAPSGPMQAQFYPPLNMVAGQLGAGFVQDGSSLGMGVGMEMGMGMGMASQDVMTEQFPGLDGLGLQLDGVGTGPPVGGPGLYEGMMEPSRYSRSPQPRGGHWDDVQFL